MTYRIVGLKLNEYGRLLKCEVYRTEMNGDDSACAAKFDMQKRGWRASIFPVFGGESDLPTVVRS